MLLVVTVVVVGVGVVVKTGPLGVVVETDGVLFWLVSLGAEITRHST